MANDRECACAKGKRCKHVVAGLIMYRGKHMTALEAARSILAKPCWKGADVSTVAGGLLVRKGTAEIRFNIAGAVSLTDAAPVVAEVSPPVSCVVVPIRPAKADQVDAGARAVEEQAERVAELEAALVKAEEAGKLEKAEPWRCMECGKQGLSAMPRNCPSCSSSRLSFDYGRPAANDWKARELMAQKWNPPRDEYARSSAGEERTTICINPFAEARS